MHRRRSTPPIGKEAYFERMKRELNLTPVQQEQMESILNDFWQYYRTVLSDSKTKVEQILNEEQRKKFEHILQEPSRPAALPGTARIAVLTLTRSMGTMG